MNIYYSDHYTVDLPEGHRFPMEKYKMLRMKLLEEGILEPYQLHEPTLPTKEELMLAHTKEYVESFTNGTIDKKIIRKIGFPWTTALVKRSYASVGGQLCAVQSALEYGISGNLSGGTHHAMADGGEGFCVFNDQAVCAKKLLRDGTVRRVAIIDLDVHQGNGNSSILGNDERVFIFSMHGEKNYPFRKIPSTIDIDLPDNTGDDEYLRILEMFLPEVWKFKPDIVLYQTGVDALKEDSLGRLAMTHEGLMQRDYLVLQTCKKLGIPVSLALGGGYAKPIELTVQAYANTYCVVRDVFG